MTLATTLPAVILDTILGRLALLFLSSAAGDVTAARRAAEQMLAAYSPETEDELCRAAEIVSFGFHALEALSQAAVPDLPLTKILRLRGCAVSLSRESHKARRKLDQLQRDRRAGIPPRPDAAQPMPERSAARVDKALALIEATRKQGQVGQTTGGKTWTQSDHQRQAARRIADNLRKNQAIHEAATDADRACLRQGSAG